MDYKVKKSCPGCGQHFSLKQKQNQLKVRVPLLLKCGHSICEICIRNILKFSEPIQCKICAREMEVTSSEKILLATNLYAVFPINVHMVGEIYLGIMDISENPTPDNNYYIDLNEIIGSLETSQGLCVECKKPTTKKCQQCESVLCEGCFSKTHKFHIFRSHVLKNIEPEFEPSCCKIHAGKKLEYFCTDCSKPNCMDCMIVGGDKSCKSHNVVSIQEMDEGVIEELNEQGPKVDEVYRRLTKTAVDIGNLLKNIDVGNCTTEIDQILIDVQNHFSKLHAAIQKHEHESLDIIENLKSREKVSLTAAKDVVKSALKKAKQVLKKIDVVMNTQDKSHINLTALLDETKEIINAPWFLTQDEKKDELKLAVNEDLCALISDYIHLDGNGDASYKLKATSEIPEGTEIPPAPSKPVFPPEIVKDIRENKPQPQGQQQRPQSQQNRPQSAQQHPQSLQPQRSPSSSQQLDNRPTENFFSTMPKYRSKSGSNSSLNSIASDNTNRPSIGSNEGSNMRGQGYNMLGDGYNMRGQGYNMNAQGYNMHGQGYNMHGQGYNMNGQGYNINGQGYNMNGQSYNMPVQNESYPGRYTPVVQPVPPFPESNHPKQLQEGMQELIYVTHIIDPNNFYVQRACHQEFVKEMQREFRNAGSMPKPSVHVSEGKIYLMFNKTDNEWQRCRIVSIDRSNASQPLYHVFCIDFGSTEIVNGEKLRLVPHARLNWPPPLAVHCGLANCEPKGGSWTTDDSVLMQQIIDNKQAVIYIRRLHSESNYSVRLVCDVTTFEHGVSLAHALAFHERGKLTNPKLPYPQTLTLAEKPKIYWHNTDYKPKMVEEILITQVISPDIFWVRKSYYQETFDQMCDELSVQYSLAISKGNVYCPIVGMPCVVNVDKYISDLGETGGNTTAGWRRAVVTDTPGRQRVGVLLLDSGVRLLVHWTQLRHATEQVFKVKALATECHLSGITPLNKKWNLGAVTLMQQYLMRPLELHVEEPARNRGSIGVVLYDKTDPDEEICLNTLMIKHKFAITIGIYTFNKSSNEELVHTNKHPLNKNKPANKPKEPTVRILQKNENLSPTKKPKVNDLEAKDKGPIKLEVKVLTCQSPSLLYVTLIDHEKSFKELFDNIQEYYNKNKTEGKTDWIVGDKCCTISKESKTWRRAVIMEMNEDQAKVFFSDFACVETQAVSALRELAPEFAIIGDAAIKCHLSGVIPAGGDEWPSLTKEFLKELIEAYQRLFITKNGAIKDKSLPVELWVYHIIQGEALEPNKAEWRCLNTKIIEQGLGVPDKTEITGSASMSDKKDDDMISFLTMTGSVHEWLKLEPQVAKAISQPTKTLESKADSSSDEDDTLTTEMEKKSLHVSDWLPAEPLPAEEFTAMPTYIDNNGVIYLHDIAQQDTLDLIRNALEVRFKYKTSKSKKTNWKVGQPCIAKFYLDNCLYRGRILEVNKETSKCIIHYIDYGNEECCAFEDMISTIVLYEIPTQAHKCILGRIKPLKDKWDSNILDYVHKSIVEKHCYVKVVGEKKGDMIPIDLKFNKLWINDHLVNFEMARYDDGSVPILPKFRAAKSPPPIVQMVESDSGPDYIEEDGDESIGPQSSDAIESTSISIDWNKLVEEEEESLKYKGRFLKYLALDVADNFECNVTLINQSILKLSILYSGDLKQKYEDMFERLQAVEEIGDPVDGLYEHKAVAALFLDDKRWYRASILESSEEKELVKVNYVDFGNDAVVSLSETREIPKEFTNLPPLCITATLQGVEVNPDTELNVLEEFEETFIGSGPFSAKVIDRNRPHPAVKLFKSDGSLAYKDLIDKGVFVVTEQSSCMKDCD